MMLLTFTFCLCSSKVASAVATENYSGGQQLLIQQKLQKVELLCWQRERLYRIIGSIREGRA